MNEQIKSIGRRAGLVFIEDGVYGQRWYSSKCGLDASEYEKLVELIVQECVAQIRPMWNQVKEVGAPPGYDYDTFDLAYNDCMNAIKEHFGVEE